MHKLDFERLLATRSRGRSAHFAIHHVVGTPTAPGSARRRPAGGDLSTGDAQAGPQAVDKLPEGTWLGCVVPKRHARRAVTRNLLRRQMRAGFERHRARLAPGLWLLRLHAGFAPVQFPSAASTALARAAREELDRLFERSALGAPR